jgi:hypothetical protein
MEVPRFLFFWIKKKTPRLPALNFIPMVSLKLTSDSAMMFAKVKRGAITMMASLGA